MTWDIGAFEYVAEDMEGTASITFTGSGSLQVLKNLSSTIGFTITSSAYLEVVFDTYGPYPDNWDDDEVFG